MNKYLYLLIVYFMTFALVSCTLSKEKQYYRKHPKELQHALMQCQEKESKHCTKLRRLGLRLDRLARELQHSPQGFGQNILSLQQTIASQEKELLKNKVNLKLKHSLAQNKEELADELAVVKWLESPES